MAFQNSRRSMKGLNSSNFKRSIDGESNPTPMNVPHFSDISNNLEFNQTAELSHKPENVSKNQITSGEPHFFRQTDPRSDNNGNFGYHSEDSPPSLIAWKNLPRTPKSYPRTKITTTTPMAQRLALQNLRRHFSFTNGDGAAYENSDERNTEEVVMQASGGLPDSHQIVSRLVQIRDCLKQVDAMVYSLKETSSGPPYQEQLDRLMKCRGQMQNSENELIDLYHKITLATREEAVGAVDGKEKHELSDTHESDNEELSSAKDNALNGMYSLSQNSITDESNLQQHRPSHKKITKKRLHKPDSFQVIRQHEPHILPSSVENSNRNQSPLPTYLITSAQSTPDSSSGVNVMVPERLMDSSSGCVTQLTEEAVIKDEILEINSQAASHSEMYHSKNEAYDQRRHLLEVLLSKKQQMDNLLMELSTLGGKAMPVIQNSGSTVTRSEPSKDNGYEHKDNNTSNNNISKDSDCDAVTLETIAKARELIKEIDARDKIRELNSMKQQLSELNEKMSARTKLSDLGNTSEDTVASENSSVRNFVSNSSSRARKSSNNSKDGISMRGRRDWSPEGHCSADEDNQSLPGATGQEDPDNWLDHPSVRDKVVKLQEAKNKLIRLEELLNAVQKAKDEGIHLPQQCKELLEVSGYVEAEIDASNHFQSQPLMSDNNLEVKHPTKTSDDSSAVIESNITERKEKMEEILKERMKLIASQNHPSSLHKLDLNNKPKVSHKESNNWPVANFRFHPNFQSGNDQRDAGMAGSGNMRKTAKTASNASHYNSVMADIQQQHDVFSELIKEEKKKQQTFLQNQDNQSVQSAKSAGTFGKSYSGGSAEVTGLTSAATWGGSTTQDNLDDGDDPNFDESQEEPEDAFSEEDQEISHNVSIPQTRIEGLPPKIRCSLSNDNSVHSNWNGLRSQPRITPSAYTRLNPVLQFERNSAERNRQDVNLTPVQEYLNDQAQRNLNQSSNNANNSAGNFESNQFQEHSRNQISYIFQRLEENINLCHTILRDQQALSNYYQSNPNTVGSRGINPGPMTGDSQLPYSNISQCFDMINEHKREIQVLQMQFNQLLRGIEENRNQSPRVLNSDNHLDVSQCLPHMNNTMQSNPSLYVPPPLMPSMLNTVDPSLFPATSPAIYGSYMNNHLYGNSVNAVGHHDAPKTLNNQVPPGTRANNYWDNFRSCSRQNLLSVHKSNEHGGFQTLPSCLLPPNIYDPSSSLPPTQIEGRFIPNRNDSSPYIAASSSTRVSGATVEQSVGDDNLLKKSGKRLKSNKDQKSDLKNACVDNRTVLPPRQSVNNKSIPLVKSNPQHNFKSRSQKPDLDGNAAGNSSQSDAYLDQLYSEAISLICENATRPMYLMEVFQLLRSIKTDDGWRRAVSSLHQLISKYSMETHSNSSAKAQSNLFSQCGFVATADNVSGKSLTDNAENRKMKSAIPSQSVEPNRNISKKLNSALPNHSTISNPASVIQTLPINDSSPSHPPQASNQIVDIKMNEPCQKSTGAIKKKRIFHSTQIEEEKVKHNTMTSTTQLNEKVFDIISKILPFIKLHIDEPCQPKVLGSICKLTMTVTYEACAESLSIDSADLMQHQLKQILQDITFKYNGQRMKECIEYLLADISEVVYNILAYYLLLKFSRAPSDSASLSDKIKSVLESLESECAGLDFNLHSTSNGNSSDVIISTSQDCLLEISQGDKLSSPKLPLISPNPVVESMTAYVNQAPNDADCEEVDPKPTADTSYYNQEIPNGLSDRIAADVEPEPEAEPEADISNKDLAEADQSPQSGTLQCSEREQVCNEVSDADKEFQSMCNGVCSPENTEDDFGMVASGGIDIEAEETDSARCNGLSGRNAFVNSTAEVSIAEPNEALSTESQQDLLRKTSGSDFD